MFVRTKDAVPLAAFAVIALNATCPFARSDSKSDFESVQAEAAVTMTVAEDVAEPPVLPCAVTTKEYVPVATPVVFHENTPVEAPTVEPVGAPVKPYATVADVSVSVATAVNVATCPTVTVVVAIEASLMTGDTGAGWLTVKETELEVGALPASQSVTEPKHAHSFQEPIVELGNVPAAFQPPFLSVEAEKLSWPVGVQSFAPPGCDTGRICT